MTGTMCLICLFSNAVYVLIVCVITLEPSRGGEGGQGRTGCLRNRTQLFSLCWWHSGIVVTRTITRWHSGIVVTRTITRWLSRREVTRTITRWHLGTVVTRTITRWLSGTISSISRWHSGRVVSSQINRIE